MHKTIALSENVIKQHAAMLDFSALIDTRVPIELRFHKSRKKGTWSFIYYEHRAKKRERLGYWPTLKASDAKNIVASVAIKLGTGTKHQQSEFNTVGHVLNWYLIRIKKESLKSSNRRANVESLIRSRLLPSLNQIALADVNKLTIDEQFILPLQMDGLKFSSIRSYFSTLKKIFRSAFDLGLISINPMAAMSFHDHIQQRIEPKPGKLLISDAAQTVDHIRAMKQPLQMLLLFMLLFATRLGETRRLKWDYIDFIRQQINIPASITKTQQAHTLPLTPQSIDLLQTYQTQSHGTFLFGGRTSLSASVADKLIRNATDKLYSAHDLRKLARSIWAQLGIDYWVGERLLNHKQKGLDAVYIKADSMDVKRKALAEYHGYILHKNVGQMQDTRKKERAISE